MLDALRIIIKNGSFVLFVVLQLFCFYWIVKYNENQSRIYFYSTQVYSNSFYNKYKSLVYYFSLKQRNDSIANENAVLLRKSFNLSNQSFIGSISLSRDSNRYEVIPSTVVNNSLARRNNTITLDKGSIDGVSEGMGVISTIGLVGIVTDVSENFSLVMSLLHSKSRISCKIPHCGFFGTLVWDGNDPMILHLEDIQRYAEIREGDSICTSGYSIVFPNNILVGKIKNFSIEPGAFTYTIKVEPTQSFLKLEQVYVINHQLKKEKELLEKKAEKYE